jgi:hypothetical protein
VINIRPPESGAGRPNVTVNIPSSSPEYQKLEQLAEFMSRRQVPPARRARGCGGCGCVGTLLFMVALGGVMFYIFGFSIKNNVMYTCALNAAKSNADVVKILGTPITADTFAWINNYKSSGSNESANFTTKLSGPKGSGALTVTGSRTSSGLSLDVFFDSGGAEITVHQGRLTCK